MKLIEESKSKLVEAPECLSTGIAQADLAEALVSRKGSKVHLSGTYEYANEVLLGPRTAPASSAAQAQGRRNYMPKLMYTFAYGMVW